MTKINSNLYLSQDKKESPIKKIKITKQKKNLRDKGIKYDQLANYFFTYI